MAEQDTATLTSNLFCPSNGLYNRVKESRSLPTFNIPQKSLTLPFCPSGDHIPYSCFSSPHRRSRRPQTLSFSLTGSAGSVFCQPTQKTSLPSLFSFLHLWKTHISPDFKGFFQSTVFFCSRGSRKILLPTTVTDKIYFHLPFLLPAM